MENGGKKHKMKKIVERRDEKRMKGTNKNENKTNEVASKE